MSDGKKKKIQTRPKLLRMVKWKPPNCNCYKTNFDGAVFKDSKEAEIGVVIRNSRGKVVASSSEKKIQNPYFVPVLELMAGRHAASFVKEVGLNNSILEGDSKIFINAQKNGNMFNSALGHLLIDNLSHLNSLKSWSLSHTLRLGNAVIDALARRARFSFPLSIWLESILPYIFGFVDADLPAS